MSDINQVLKETGDEALDLIKSSFKELLLESKKESNKVIKETGEKLEKWLIMRDDGELDDDELESLMNTRKRVVRQFLNTQDIAARARFEKLTMGLIDMVTNKFIGVIF
jgi:hypothetical protein